MSWVIIGPRARSKAESALVLVDILDRVRDGANLLGGVVGDFHAELFLEGHHQFDDIKAVGTKIIDEAGVFSDLLGLDAQVLDDNLLNPVGGVAHGIPLLKRQIKNSLVALMAGVGAGKVSRLFNVPV